MSDQDQEVPPVEIAEDEQKNEEVKINSENSPGPQNLEVTNVIVTPSNCPEGFQRGSDGVCREVF